MAFLGAGGDQFIWNPGDGSDTVDGQGGFDTLLFNGANVGENIDILANGLRTSFTRDVANITMDLNHLEFLHFNALGGADNVIVDDLTGTSVIQVAIDLAGTLGGVAGDGQVDTVTVRGTAGVDHISVTASGTSLSVDGLSAQVLIDHAESTDALSIAGGGGDDTIDASSL